ETLSVTSPVIDAGQLFDRVGVHWRAARGQEDTLLVEVRTSADGARWGEWELLHPEEDLADLENNVWYAAPIPAVAGARFAQYRVWLTDGDPAALQHLAVTVLDVTDLNEPALVRLLGDVKGALTDVARALSGDARVASAAPAGASKILTRQDWGADESLMKWTPAYAPWQKAVIHHTVTRDGGTNVAAEIRSIYYFHAVTRGWGDIGYNFLVDKYGNIWTGRQGGDHAIGGHAYGWNTGSFAVAAIGDYSVTAPTGQLQGAIANVIAMKFKQLGIQPYGNGSFTHEEQRSDGSWTKVTSVVPNVLGHRDCTFTVGRSGGQTACPGGALYTMMDGLRKLAQSGWQNGYTYLSRIDPQLPPGGFPGQALQVPVLVTNLGTVTIPAGTTVSYRVLRAGSVVTQGPGVALAQPVAPGATGSTVVSFVGPPLGEYVVRWGLQTGGALWNALYNDPVRDVWFRSADWSADWLSDTMTRTWTAGETRTVTVTVRNDGGRTWNAAGTNPVKLGYYWISTATGNRFEGALKMSLAQDVAPGQQVTLNIPVTAPVYPTNYTHVFDLYKENEFWFKDKGLRPDDTPVTVSTDFKATYQVGSPLPKLEAGKTVIVPVTVTNTGKGTFPVTSSYPVTLGYHWYDAAGLVAVWDGTRTQLPADLLAGQSATLQASVAAPPKGGTYTLRFDLVQEGVGWFSSKGVATGNVTAVVAGPVVPVYGAAYQPAVSTLAQSGGLTAVPFTVTNTSNFTWSPGGSNPIALSYHWSSASGQTVTWEGLRTQLPSDVAPGAAVQLQARVQ
ncbi:MAG: N-acetylmuramoyl-L-alanine amidase, partial [Chloroflexota bacterium]